MTANIRSRLYEFHRPHKVNSTTWGLVSLFVLVQGLALFYSQKTMAATEPSERVGALGGIELGFTIVFASLVLLLLIRFGAIGVLRYVFRVVSRLLRADKAVSHPQYWVVFNAVGLALAAYLASIIGVVMSFYGVIGLLALMVLWDEYAVNYSDNMLDLAEGIASPFIPNVVVIPSQWNLNLTDVFSQLKSGDIDGVKSIIGVGDFAFPAMLTVVVFHQIGPVVALLTVLGGVIGMIELHSTILHTDEAKPGLPNLCGGAFAGLLVGLVVMAV